MARVHSTQEFALVEAEGQCVIRLMRAGLPCRLLTGEHDRQAVEIGDHAAIDRFLEGKQPCLVGEQLSDGDPVLPLLRELGPVSGHALFVVQPTAGVGDRESHRGETLGRRVDHHHGVRLPRRTGLLVADAAPEIDDLFAAMIDTTAAAQLPATREVLDECVAHGLEARADVPVHDIASQSSDEGHSITSMDR